MTSQDQFVAEIEAFLSRTGMAQTTLGLRAINDATFVRRLCMKGATCTLRTADRVRQFMRENDAAPDRDAAA